MMPFNHYRARFLSLLLLVSVCVSAWADRPVDAAIDSLRQTLKDKQGEARQAVWQDIYNQALTTGDYELQGRCLNDWMLDARQHGDANSECVARTNKLIDFFNSTVYDSIYAQVPQAMDFALRHGFIKKYFEAWHLLTSTYYITGQYSTALREVQRMHEDALRRKETYGQALAYFDMGNIYFGMGHMDESATAFSKSYALMADVPEAESVLLDLLPYYCDALEGKKDYQKLDAVTRQWWQYLQSRWAKGNTNDQDPMLANYYIACVQAQVGLNQLDKAWSLLDKAEEHVKSKDAYEWLYVLYYRAQLCMLRGDYTRAIALNGERLRLCSEIEDKPTLIPVHKQRAQILMRAGRYEEAAEMYRRTFELSDSLNTAATRSQLNELNTLFRVDELEMKNALQKSRFVSIVIALVALVLLFYLLLRYRASVQLKRKNEELARSNAELKLANERAEESSRMKSEFIKNISHEIRTPLNILNGFAQVIMDEGMELTEAQKAEIRQNISENTDRITEQVDKILELSDASSRTVLERADRVEAVRLAAEAADMAHVKQRTAPAQADSAVTFSLAPDVPADLTLLTHRRYACRALECLLDNAVKFTRKGTITLRVEQPLKGGVVAFIIEDTGIGVPASESEHIFDEFVQEDSYADGTGIGLTVARSMARRLGGDIVLDTSYGRTADSTAGDPATPHGARFVMTLPL